MAETKIIPELDPSRDLAVLKTNGSFSGTFTTSSGTVTISYGDGNEETSNTPSHTFNTKPPYILNVKDIELENIDGIDINGNDLSSVNVSEFKNVTTVDISDNNITANRLSDVFKHLDDNGQTNGTLDISNNSYIVPDFTAEQLAIASSLTGKGWVITGL
jgi:hypothetical protein